MLRVGEFNLSSMQEYANSLEDVLKQTIISQETIFRTQVYELHRLYEIQKTLMEDCGRKQLDAYNLWKISAKTFRGPFSNSIQFAALTKGEMFSRSPVVGSTDFLNEDVLEEKHRNCCKIQHEPADFHLLGDQHAYQFVKDPLEKGNCWDLRNSAQPKDWFLDRNVSSPEELDLTLSIGGKIRQRGSGNAIYSEENSHSFSHHVIDLEASTDMESHENANTASALSCATLITWDKQESQVHAPSNQVSGYSVKKGTSHGLTMSYSSVNGNKSSEEENFSHQGCKEPPSGIASNNMLSKRKPCNSHETFELDLNKLQFDDNLNDPVDVCFSMPGSSNPLDRLKGVYSEGTCSAAACCGNQNDNGLKEPSILLQEDDDLKGNFADLCTAEETEMREEDDAFFHPCKNRARLEDLDSNIICINDDSSSGAKTMQSGTDCDQFRQYQSIHVEETQSIEQDLGSCDGSELEDQCCKKMNDESPGGDALTQKAAELLIQFSLGGSPSDGDTQEGTNQIENEGRDQSQCSIDSYESLVMKLTESSVDDYCVSSKPFEFNDVEKKDGGVKLRRGRRLKDFQKDILPGLASLSKHEIREDVGIMEAVIRSREYKRMRSKVANGGNWFTPAKSKRSRLSYVGRRCYS